MLDTFRHDLKFGLKVLWKNKLFTITALLTLAVCIGANTTIFSAIYTVLLRPLPYPESDRLVVMYNSYPQAGAEIGSNAAGDYFFRREEVDALEYVAAFQGAGFTVGEEGHPERVSGLRVTPELLPLLDYAPVMGRNFAEEEMDPGSHQVVILTHGLWQERFDADPSVLGETMRMNSRPFTIVGILPEGFRFIGNQDPRLLVPTPFTPEQRTVESLHSNSWQMIGRLAEGASLEQARSQIDALNQRLIDEWPLPNSRQVLEDAGFHTQVHPLQEWLVRDIRPMLYMLWAGVFFVLIIGVVNIANLMLARSNTRMGELATRFVLGADRRRLMGQLVTESTLLAVLGGLAGIGIGAAGIRFLETLGADQMPRGTEIAISVPVVLFALALAVGAGALFGVIPMLQVSRTDLGGVFRDEGRTGTAGRTTMLLRSGLVVGQVAIAFALLIGAGLMFSSFRNVMEVDPGFQPDGVLTGMVNLPGEDYPNDEAVRTFQRQLLQEVEAIPGVEYAGLANQLPFSGNNNSSVVIPEGYEPQPGESLLAPRTNWVSSRYHRAMGIPLLEGRTFEPSDDADSEPVMIIDAWLADRYWPDESALGKRMYMGAPGMAEEDIRYMRVVGVVGEIEFDDLASERSFGAYYMPLQQYGLTSTYLAVRTAVEPTSVTSAVRSTVSRLDPDLPFYGVETMRERIEESLASRRSSMLLLLIFAGVALFLAAVGIYGVLAYTVSQRVRELGVRMALGSSTGRLFRLMVVQGLRLVGLGLVIGAAGSFALVRLIRSQLYGVQPADPAVFGAVAGILALVGLAACLVPARRASVVDPVVALSPK
ncbi:MAG: ABC transporter permease [bacterium]